MTTVTLEGQTLERFRLFLGGTEGLGSWVGPQAPEQMLASLADIESHPLSKARLNQLLTLAHQAPVSEAMFRYYWLSFPTNHPYDVRKIPGYDQKWISCDQICSLDQLYWGLYRFYVDALLFFGNVRTAFRTLRRMSENELEVFFRHNCVSYDDLAKRGDPFLPTEIAKDNRYLISEMACKSYGEEGGPGGEISKVLTELYEEHLGKGGGPVTVNELLSGAFKEGRYEDKQMQLELSADDFLDDIINEQSELMEKIGRVQKAFNSARNVALENTKIYLSMVGDLDVYVATSMRIRQDFRDMADFCEAVFSRPEVEDLELRYFDPTLSAAEHHEDKGLLECLMVKCAKVLILHAGKRDSYGKDAEAAMALSLGKPVIIHADEEYRSNFFRDVHPLSRLIDFKNGVAVGAMIATSPQKVAAVIRAVLTNDMEYTLDEIHPGYLVLREKITESVVRLQTSDVLLRETFWNHYHNEGR